MEEQKLSTEEQILEAAERVFLEKGFKSSKTSDIAEAAGVNNALINYYFRSKKNLFEKVLRGKIELLANSLSHVSDQELPFEMVLKNMIETQFEFFKNNESLPRFIITEILMDTSRTNIFRDNLIPIVLKAITQLGNKLQQEIAAGNVRNISMFELLYTVTAVNVFCFIVKPVIVGLEDSPIAAFFSDTIANRRDKNVEIIMSYLKNISES